MTRGWFLLRGLAAASLLVAGCEARPTGIGGSDAGPSGASPSTILLVADLSEADATCRCGDVIRAVRAAAARGARTREVDVRNKPDLAASAQKYKIVVQPAVVMLDDADRELRRFEGESKEVVQLLKADLDQIPRR